MRLFLVAAKPSDAVTSGFLPAAGRLGLDVVLLTDQPYEHARALERSAGPARPGSGAEPWILPCDVRDTGALIGRIAGLRAPDAIFTNSGRLGVQTALAADYFGVPGQDWRACLRARDTLLMRRRLAHTGAEKVAAVEVEPGPVPVPGHLRYPVVLRAGEGAARLADDPEQVARRRAEVSGRLICEEYLPGTPRTLETLGDGEVTWLLGGFRVRVSAPPFFIRERLTWDPLPPDGQRDRIGAALGDLGVSFGAGHTEFIDDGRSGAMLVGTAGRLIGDHCDFLLASLLGIDLFEAVLRVHLGQRLPDGPPPARGHAVAEYVVAGQAGVLGAGVLRAAPPAGPMAGAEPGVELGYWPLRQIGERIAVTRSRLDYLGVITAVGPDLAAAERSVAAARSAGGWAVT